MTWWSSIYLLISVGDFPTEDGFQNNICHPNLNILNLMEDKFEVAAKFDV